MAGGFDVKAQRVHPIGGEVEFGLALFGDGDVEDRRIVFAGADAQRPIFPEVGTRFSASPRLSATGRAMSGSLPISVLLSSANSASGGEFSNATATVSLPGTAK